MDHVDKKTKKHPDIGKRVRWKLYEESGDGVLLVVDCDESEIPHLVKRNDGQGWSMNEYCSTFSCNVVQGVSVNETNCYWVDSYEVIEEEPRTLTQDRSERCWCVTAEGNLLSPTFSFSKPLPHYVHTYSSSITKKPMSKLITFFRNMTRDADSKLLIEAGLENEDGTPTNQGYEMSRELSYKANRAQIIDIVKQAKAEEKE